MTAGLTLLSTALGRAAVTIWLEPFAFGAMRTTDAMKVPFKVANGASRQDL